MQRAKDCTHIDMFLLYESHQIASLVSYLISYFSKWMFSVWQENATKFGTKIKFYTFFFYHHVTSFGYIIVNSGIISFNLNCIMHLKQFYNIATKVSSRKKCYYFWWSTWLLNYISAINAVLVICEEPPVTHNNIWRKVCYICFKLQPRSVEFFVDFVIYTLKLAKFIFEKSMQKI